ncbi:MAG: carboxypeptidase regulatory-like domain-containing protein [Chitinophagaceae bacterium]|nr:MAG: carboxypeptidase regulatory-like domain-containing protein [Chitinophagaceae bacterium]
MPYKQPLMRILSKLTFIAFAAIAIGSCQKHVDYVGGPDVQPVLPDPITATLQGNVFDENGAPAPAVTVKVGTQTASTDSRGYFRITGAALDKHQALVTATKSGYFKAYRTFAATSGANQVSIKLLKRTVTGTVDATTGGAATLANGSKVELPAGGIVDASTGAAYSGAVKVFASYIDPSAQDIGQVIPGSLMANDKDGRRVVLNSFGMLAVELEGASGQKLQIKSGQNAVLTTAIPAAAQASAPATIPLWYVDENTGIWKEQGSATKVGNTYVGNVPHFSFWNCDQPMDAIQLSLTMNGSNNQPLRNTTVRLRRPGNGWWTVSYGVTDSLGQVSGMVPSNEQLMLEVLDNCWATIYTQNIGPFATNTTLPAITANSTASALTTVTGTLVDCSNAPVTNGYAIIVLNNYVQYVGVNSTGQFSANILSCNGGGTIEVLGINNATAAQSSVSSFPFAAGTTSAGTISACTQSAAEYINYTIDGGTQVSLVAGDSLSYYAGQQGATNWNTYISGDNMSTPRHNISFNFSSPTAVAGTYNITSLYVENQQNNGSQVTTTVTNWPASLGGYIEGTLTGSYVVGTTTHTITGSYRLRRLF